MRVTYARLSYVKSTEFGEKILSAVSGGTVEIEGSHWEVLSREPGKYAGVEHLMLRSAPDGATVDDDDVPPSELLAESVPD